MFLGLPDQYPNPLVRGMDPRIRIRIRIRTKISRIPQPCLQEHYCAGCGAEHLSELREDLQGDSRADL
jgi:hypothetical protein